jgi:hypothetical protein
MDALARHIKKQYLNESASPTVGDSPTDEYEARRNQVGDDAASWERFRAQYGHYPSGPMKAGGEGGVAGNLAAMPQEVKERLAGRKLRPMPMVKPGEDFYGR